MREEELGFEDDKLVVYTPISQYGDGICKVQLVMTKEIFQECYKRWIEPQPKTGHWIDTGSGQMCSSCNEIQYGYDSFRRFCASCGARMIELQESEGGVRNDSRISSWSIMRQL